jgi:ribosomal protein S18 acetylase RimI-like enzyme
MSGPSDLPSSTPEKRASTILVRLADLADPGDGCRVVELLDMYSREPLGQAAPLPEDVRKRLVPGLRRHPGALVLLAFADEEAVGIAVCFLGFSTFAAQPLLNIHDLAVRPDSRGSGVGRALLRAAQEQAVQRSCCKITLEVRDDNRIAQRLYRDFGFASSNGDAASYAFWTKSLRADHLG